MQLRQRDLRHPGRLPARHTLEVSASLHQGRYGIEIMIELLGDGTCSWAMIVNGINKNVTEMTELRVQTKCVYGTSRCMH